MFSNSYFLLQFFLLQMRNQCHIKKFIIHFNIHLLYDYVLKGFTLWKSGFSIWRAPFQKGLGPFFMKVDVLGLIYRFWVALFAKPKKKKKISLESG